MQIIKNKLYKGLSIRGNAKHSCYIEAKSLLNVTELQHLHDTLNTETSYFRGSRRQYFIKRPKWIKSTNISKMHTLLDSIDDVIMEDCQLRPEHESNLRVSGGW